MSWPPSLSPNLLALLCSLPLLGLLGVHTWRNRDAPAASPILLLLLMRGLWVLGRLFELGSAGLEAKLIWFRLAQATLPVAAALAPIILDEYIRPGHWRGRRNLALLFAPAVLFSGLVLLNPAPLPIQRRVWLDEFMHSERSLFTWVFLCYFLAHMATAQIRLIRFALRWPMFRWPAVVLLTALAATLSMDALTSTGLIARTPLDPAILAFDLNLVLLVLVSVGMRQLLDIVPIAWEVVVQRMQDGIVVLDTRGRVAFHNPAARAILPAQRPAGRQPASPLSAGLSELAAQALARPAEIEVAVGGEQRHFTVGALPLDDPRGRTLGQLLTFHDITDQVRTRQMQLQQQRVQAMLDERERIAGELHDDLGQVMGFVKLQAQAARDLLATHDHASAEQALARLVAVTQAAHTDVREFILGAQTTDTLAAGLAPALEHYLRQLQQHFGLKAQLHKPPDWHEAAIAPAAAAQALRIVQEALANARKHAQASRVSIRLANVDGQAHIIIQDDGQGFDVGREGSGLAYGLRLMRQRAQDIGAELQVNSAPDQGTQVVLRLPAAAASAGTASV